MDNLFNTPSNLKNSLKLPLISIIINCYNGSAFLSDAINSIFAQTYPNWEIIFWDNHSTDDSAAIFKSFNDDRLHYYYAPTHTPLGEARNQAFSCVRGEWVAFFDCDDIWLPDKLEKQINLILRGNLDIGIVYGQMLVLYDEANYKSKSRWVNRMQKYSKKTLLAKLPEGDVFRKLLLLNFIPLISAIFRADLFRKVGGVDDSFEMSEDYDLFLKIAKVSSVLAVQEVVALYRLHGGNTSIGKLDQGFLETIAIINRYLPDPFARRALKFHTMCNYIQQKDRYDVINLIKKTLFSFDFFSIFCLIRLRLFKKI